MGFSQALSGLNSAATNIDVIGNNIANSQTVGFKGSRTMFADVFAGAEVGLGTRVTAVLQDFSAGTLESTNRSLDLAITGSGFFRFSQEGQVMFSRNGQLTLSSDGFLVNPQGARLTGLPGAGGGGNPVELQVPSGALPAKATTAIDVLFNLDGRETAIAAPFDPNDASTYSFTNNVTIFDSLGNDHTVTQYFIKTADNVWDVRLSREGELAPEIGNVTFDTQGLLATTTNLGSFTFVPGNGVANLDIAMSLAGSTQFGNEFELSSLSQDGFRSGSLLGVSIEENGNVVGNYSNEQTQILGTIVLANFANPEGLESVGENAWIETGTSGAALLGEAGIGLFGTIQSGVTESSNVDLTQELINLIIAQRNFQANSQTIQVQDEVLQDAVNLRR
ncbi:MAG: flagellar hook protein FlgE [Pseudomonadales bacterium]|nr:flagellar hook protein FlgE [Pseudomonadales bacterium]